MIYTIDILGHGHKEFHKLEDIMSYIYRNNRIIKEAFSNKGDSKSVVKLVVKYDTEPSSICDAEVGSILEDQNNWSGYYKCHNINQDETEDQCINSLFLEAIKKEIDDILKDIHFANKNVSYYDVQDEIADVLPF